MQLPDQQHISDNMDKEQNITLRFRLPCPKCGKDLPTDAFVANKYPDGYRRTHYGYNPEGKTYYEKYPANGTTLSNTMFFRCPACNTNVKWEFTSRIKE